MKQLRNSGRAILFAVAAALLTGCKEKRQATSPPTPVDPAASFERVVQNLRHYLGQLRTEPISSFENGAFTSMSHSRELTAHRVIPPTEENGDYRGQIEVTTKWAYSYQPSIESDPIDSTENQQAAKRKDASASAQDYASPGIEILDSDLIAEVGEEGRSANPLLAGTVDTNPSEERIRKFQFEFKDGRWEFVEETVEEETPQSDEDKPMEKDPYALDVPDTVLDAVKRALVVQ